MVRLFATAAVLALIYMTLVFLLALAKKNNGVVDIAWGLGFILVGGVVFRLQGLGHPPPMAGPGAGRGLGRPLGAAYLPAQPRA